uniref:FLYWCH-type domain-containing protein n=1 Tax=Panagrolaimus sp. ES5 TaxID=591445 RepID=A0AC34FI89_9BILA
MGSNQSSPGNVLECPSNSAVIRSLSTENGQSDVPIKNIRAMSNLDINESSIKDAAKVPEYRFGKNPKTGADMLFIEGHPFDFIKSNKGDKKRHWKCKEAIKLNCKGNAKTSESGELLLNDPYWNWNHVCGFKLSYNARDNDKAKSDAIYRQRSQSLCSSKSYTKSSSSIGLSSSFSGSGRNNNSHNKVEANQNLNATNVGNITHSPKSYKSETNNYNYVF